MARTISVLISVLLALLATAHAQPTIRLPVIRAPNSELLNAPRFITGRKMLQEPAPAPATLAPALAISNMAETPLASAPVSVVPVVLPTTLLRSAVGAPSAERLPTGVAAGQLANALASLEAVRAEGK